MATNPIVVSLSSLSGGKGFRLDGVAAGDRSGRSVSSAGDVNGDGFDDIIIGASDAAPNGNDSGSCYVVFGKASGFGLSFDLSTLDGTNGFRLDGTTANFSTGVSVASAGDINNDGIDDIIIGAHTANNSGLGSGSSYVVFGKTSGFSSTLPLSSLDGTNGFRLDGVIDSDFAGISVASAGDVNGDGIGDVIIGASRATHGGTSTGSAFVVFGSDSGFTATSNLSSLDGTNGFRLDGLALDDFTGRQVASAGDINGDGFDDVVVSAFGADQNGSYSGSAYVVFGKGTSFAGTLNLSTLNGSNGFRIDGVEDGDNSGFSLSSAGDVNGDGFDDVIIGANGAGPFNNGAGYVVFGTASGFSSIIDLANLNGSNGFRIEGDQEYENVGQSVAAAGDVNGDGIDDLLIGGPNAFENGILSGGAYVVFGTTAGFSSVFDLTTLDGSNGFRILGGSSSYAVGGSVASAGDVNGDGFDDIIIGALNASFGGYDSGSSFVIFGRATDDITRTGTNVANRLFGGDYDDALNGLAGNDILTGRLGDDRLIGSTGRDTLNGGKGRDILNGGTDSDRFRFTAGDSGQTAAAMDRVIDFTKGAVNTGDRFDFTEILTKGGAGSGAAATADRASIHQGTGVATFAAGSGTTLADALSDIATRWTLSTDSLGEYALFQINNTGNYHIFVSDGVAGVTANDLLVQLTGITSIGSVNLSGGDLTILT